MILSMWVAWNFHRSFKRSFLVSVVSLFSIISLTVGIAISITAFSVINGFKYELNRRILSIIPHAEIVPIHTPFINWKIILNWIKTVPNIVNVNPYINFSGIIENNNIWHVIHIKSVNLTGNIFLKEKNKFLYFIESKSWDNFCKNSNQIILGRGVSDVLKVKSGDWITVLIPRYFNNINNKISSFQPIRLQVSGILNLNSRLDDHFGIITFKSAQSYFNNRIDVDGIEISVNDVFCIDQIIQNIGNKFPKEINIHSWKDTYGYVYRDIQMVRMIIYLSITLIIGMSFFSIFVTLVLSIKNKDYDIAIFRVLGANSILIQKIFLWYGFIIYCIASLIGIGAGVFISWYLQFFSSKYSEIFHNKFLPKGIYLVDFMPIKLNNQDIYLILIIILILGLLVSWYASLKIKRTNFIRILR